MSESGAGMATVICLDGPLTIGSADLIRSRILESIGRYRSTEIDCKSETEIDISFIQIFIAARKYAKQQDRSIFLSKEAGLKFHATLNRAGLLKNPGSDGLTNDGLWTGDSAA